MISRNFSPFPFLESQGLILRQLNMTDAKALHLLRSDELVNRYIARAKQVSIEDALSFVIKMNQGIAKNKLLYWGISFQNEPQLIGTICLWNFNTNNDMAEVGFELSSEHHGQGIMHKALGMVLAYSFETIGLKRVSAYTHRQNVGSKKLLEKNGFRYMRDARGDEVPNNLVYELSVSDFIKA